MRLLFGHTHLDARVEGRPQPTGLSPAGVGSSLACLVFFARHPVKHQALQDSSGPSLIEPPGRPAELLLAMVQERVSCTEGCNWLPPSRLACSMKVTGSARKAGLSYFFNPCPASFGCRAPGARGGQILLRLGHATAPEPD